MTNKKLLEKSAPWILLIATILLWQLVCTVFNVSEFVFPSPWQIVLSLIEFWDTIAMHAWRTFWTTMVGFGISIVAHSLLCGLPLNDRV
jgi:NitT/TauT family transport system permease protein